MSYQPPGQVSAEKARVLRLAYDHVVPGRVQGFHELGVDLVMGRREGYRFWDLDGQEYLDFHLNGGVFTLGHRNPELLAVLRASLEWLDIGNHHFPSVARANLAELLIRLAPGNMQYVVFATGGSEAIDVAIKSARRATGRRKIVSLDIAYHGRTGLSGATGDDATAVRAPAPSPLSAWRPSAGGEVKRRRGNDRPSKRWSAPTPGESLPAVYRQMGRLESESDGTLPAEQARRKRQGPPLDPRRRAANLHRGRGAATSAR